MNIRVFHKLHFAKKKMQYQYAPLTGVYKPDMKEFLKITISGSQSVRSTKVPVVPFLEQHSTKIQILLQHMNLRSAQVNIKKKDFKKSTSLIP